MVDLTRIQRDLGSAAEVVLVHPRLLRQVVKADRAVSAVGVVPHGRCYEISRSKLKELPVELRLPASGMAQVILVAEPTVGERRRASPSELHERVFRAAFHASVHMRFDSLIRDGRLTDRDVQDRVFAVGRAEFQEIRAIVTHDEQLLPPGSDLEVYVEFAASYLELRRFAPGLIGSTFPGLGEAEDIEAVLSADVDVEALLALGDPDVAIPLTVRRAPPSSRTIDDGPPVSDTRRRRLLAAAQRATVGERHAVAATLAARAVFGVAGPGRVEAEQVLDEAVGRLAFRLEQALGGPLVDETGEPPRVRESLTALARRAARRSRLRPGPEAAVLHELERAARAFEAPGFIVDGVAWVLSRGRRPAVRPRSASRELQVARILDRAAARVQDVKLRAPAQADLARLLKAAAVRAETRVRAALGPRIHRTFERVGLVARSQAEGLSRDKLVEELLDEILARGSLSLPQLRDAVSENQLKLPDLNGARELVRGDPLLRVDARLAIDLDGIYRRGDVYLRFLQKLSSLPFGTRVGRILALFLILPALGSFTIVEGTRHILNPLLRLMSAPTIPPAGWLPLVVTGAALLALLHSETARIVARQLLDVIGVLLAWVLFRIPRAVLSLPLVTRVLELPAVRWVLRRIAVPGVVAVVAYALGALYELGTTVRVAATAGTFVIASFVLGSRLGWWLEGLFFERIAPTWHVLSRQWLPGFLRLVGGAFAGLMDMLERGMTRVHDALRFRRTRSPGVLWSAGVLGALWAFIAYVVRVYMTLLVEPELNPLKHFPVVTVAHKLLLPFLPDLLRAFERPFSMLGPVVGGAGAAVTVFLLPSVFGFLAWELKENYRVYRATRVDRIEPARFGPHGETMRGLLVVGVHSGTVPKLYEQLRHAAHRQHAARMRARGAGGSQADGAAGLGRFQEGRRVVTRAITRFAERELIPRIVASPRWSVGALAVRRIGMSSNRIRVRIGVTGRAEDDDCELAFEQLGGTLVASIPQPGFVAHLDPEQALIFENALVVFYQRAEVAVVREQLEAELGSVAHYDISGDTLVVWPDEDYRVELAYALGAYRPRQLRPRVRIGDGVEAPRLGSQRILLRQQRVTWQAWERAFGSAVSASAILPRLVSGPPLLPTGVIQVTPRADEG